MCFLHGRIPYIRGRSLEREYVAGHGKENHEEKLRLYPSFLLEESTCIWAQGIFHQAYGTVLWRESFLFWTMFGPNAWVTVVYYNSSVKEKLNYKWPMCELFCLHSRWGDIVQLQCCYLAVEPWENWASFLTPLRVRGYSRATRREDRAGSSHRPPPIHQEEKWERYRTRASMPKKVSLIC